MVMTLTGAGAPRASGGGAATIAWATASPNKSQYATVNGTGNLVATGSSGFADAAHSVRADTAKTGKRQFEYTLTTYDAGGAAYVWIGVDDGTDNFADTGTTNFSRPGRDNASGVSLKIRGFNWAIYSGGSTTPVQTGSSPTVATTSTLTCEYDSAAGTLTFYTTFSGATTQVGSTLTGLSFSNWYADCGFENNDVASANFFTGQVRALSSGYSVYDS